MVWKVTALFLLHLLETLSSTSQAHSSAIANQGRPQLSPATRLPKSRSPLKWVQYNGRRHIFAMFRIREGRECLSKPLTMTAKQRLTQSTVNLVDRNTHLPITGTQKHLGLNFTGNLQWEPHLSTVISKTRRLLGLLKRLKESRLNKRALPSIFKVYIRPQLEYASTAWSNLTQQQSDTLERFKRKAAKIILGYRLSDHHNYTYFCLLLSGTHLRRGEHCNLQHSDLSSSQVQLRPISSPQLLHDTPHQNHCATQGSLPSHLPTLKHISRHPFSKHAKYLFKSLPHNTQSATSYQQSMSLASPRFLSTQRCCSAHIPRRPSLSTSTYILDRTGPRYFGASTSMQGSAWCSKNDKLHPARQASFWSMKWLGTGIVNPWSLPFSRCSPFSLSLSLSLFLSSCTYPLIRFEFLVLVLGLGHSFSSPTFAFRCCLMKMNWSSFLGASLFVVCAFAHSRVLLSDIKNQWSWDYKGKL